MMTRQSLQNNFGQQLRLKTNDLSRPSEPWFENLYKECRVAKRLTRRFERASAAANRQFTTTNTLSSSFVEMQCTTAASAIAAPAWCDRRRSYRQLRHQKRAEFCMKD